MRYKVKKLNIVKLVNYLSNKTDELLVSNSDNRTQNKLHKK